MKTPQLPPLAGMTPLGLKPAVSELAHCYCGHSVECHDCETGKCYYKDEKGKCFCSRFDAAQTKVNSTAIEEIIERTLNDSCKPAYANMKSDLIKAARAEHAALKEAARMLIALVEFKEGEDDGGEGITAEDWKEANRIIRNLAKLREGKAKL